MTKLHEPLDSNGKRINAGDRAVLEKVSEKLLSGLPTEDQIAIKAQAGKLQTISSFDEHGYAEIEFVDAKGTLHTIWIEPACLRKQA
ncbi:MAG: hypothetical protein ACYC9J_15315 [Sulfuricaulis sp.]